MTSCRNHVRIVGFDCRVSTEAGREEALGDDLFTIGFLSHGGASTSMPGAEPEPLPEPPPDSMETMLHALGRPYLFLDLRRPEEHWLSGTWSAGFYFYEQQTKDWPRFFDALFFIDVQHPSTLLPSLDRQAPAME